MKIGVHFGALADPIGQQLYEQGVEMPSRDSELAQRHADAIVILSIHGILSDAEAHRARKRLMKRITKASVALAGAGDTTPTSDDP